MKVATVFPSCNIKRARNATRKWKKQGYDVFIYLDNNMPRVEGAFCFWGIYPGWYTACNVLCRIASDYDAVVCIGDDMDPDPNKKAKTIVKECYKEYGDLWVMQPRGDKIQGNDICGSPWLSAEWIRRAYKGMFALPGWYWHQFGDNEIQYVSNELGVLHNREDLIQYHHHWIRPGSKIKRTDYQIRFSQYWDSDQKIYKERLAAGWPGMNLL
jgi:hypothetical protein